MIIKIDTSKWLTPSKYAELKGVSNQVVNNWIKREKLKTWYIEELGLRLVSLEN